MASPLISEIDRADLRQTPLLIARPGGGSSAPYQAKAVRRRSAESAGEELQEGEATRSRSVAANAISTGDNGSFNKTCRASARS